MATTNFIDGVTTIVSSWLNDVNTKTYNDTSSTVAYTPAGTGAVATTVQTKLRESISVKDFGVTGNGTTDDSTNINAAVDYLVSVGGGKLFFPPGTYKLAAASIKLRSNIEYVGAGIGSTVIQLSTAGSYYPSGFANYPATTPYNHIRISDMTIDGNYSVTPDGGNDNYQHGIYSTVISDATYERLEFKNIWYVGIENYNNCNRNTISNCRFINVGDKNTIVGGTGSYYGVGNDFSVVDTKIINNQFTNCGQGINLYGDGGAVDNCVITGNQFYNIKAQCIYGRQGVQNLVVSNNTAKGIGKAFIDIYDNPAAGYNGGYTYNVLISNNVAININTNSGSGIYAINIIAQYGLSILGNTISGADNLSGSTGGIAIGVTATYTEVGAIISGNSLFGKFYNAQAILNNGAQDCRIINNFINGNSVANGMLITSASLRTVIEGNTFFNCANNISDSSTSTIINGIKIVYPVVWTSSSSPQPVLGNGSLVGWYVRYNNIIHLNISMVMGSTTTYGTGVWFFSLPETPLAGISYYPGSCAMSHTGISDYIGVCRADSTNGIRIFTGKQPAETVGASLPFAWAATDFLNIQLSYEV